MLDLLLHYLWLQRAQQANPGLLARELHYPGTITAFWTLVLGITIAVHGTGAAIIIIVLLVASKTISAASTGFFNSLFLGRTYHFYELFHSLSR